MSNTRRVLLVLAILLTVAMIGSAVNWGLISYLYTVRVRQYISQADDASTPAAKLKYLLIYKAAVQEHVGREDARYIFKQARLTRTVQLGMLDSLIERIRDLSEMKPDALAYQTGIQQVTGQEIDHVLDEIDGVFKDCYLREFFWIRYGAPAVFFFMVLIVMPVVWIIYGGWDD